MVAGLHSEQALSAAFQEMSGRLGAGGYVVEEMDARGEVVELIVGARWDPSFGPVVLVGAGGVLAELYQDVTTELAPVDRACALAMVSRLRCAPLLTGWRGSQPLDVTGVADVIVAVSNLITAHPGIGEIEFNPVRVGAAGAIAVDAAMILADAGGGPGTAGVQLGEAPR